MFNVGEKTAELLARVRRQKPLVHHITNLVVTNDTANVTLGFGGLPVMAHAAEEAAEMTSAAQALLLNIGTLTPALIDSMLIAGKKANELGIPVVLDPVGAGATSLRTASAQRLLNELKISIVRGNSAEIAILGGYKAEIRGVESTGMEQDLIAVARTLAEKYSLTVAMTGKQDIITDGRRVALVDNGHQWLTTLTGTGCMSTTAVAVFAGVEQDFVLAAQAALTAYGIAAELAAIDAKGPGSFKAAFFDEIYNLDHQKILAYYKVKYI